MLHNHIVISNNCASHYVYDYYGMPYNHPITSLRLGDVDWIRLLSNLSTFDFSHYQIIPDDENLKVEYIDHNVLINYVHFKPNHDLSFIARRNERFMKIRDKMKVLVMYEAAYNACDI